MLVTLLGGKRSIGVDRNKSGAAPFCLLRASPEVHARRDRIRAPNQDQLAFLEKLEVHADAGAIGVLEAGGACRRANGAVKARCAEFVEETLRDAFTLHQTHRACVAVWEQCLGFAAHDVGQARGGDRKRLVPADRLEPSFALAPDPLQRHRQALAVMNAFRVSAHLRAKYTLRRRVIGIAHDFHRLPVLDAHTHRASIGTVMRTNGPGKFGGGIHRVDPRRRRIRKDSPILLRSRASQRQNIAQYCLE